jgi:hypothetical protein
MASRARKHVRGVAERGGSRAPNEEEVLDDTPSVAWPVPIAEHWAPITESFG